MIDVNANGPIDAAPPMPVPPVPEQTHGSGTLVVPPPPSPNSPHEIPPKKRNNLFGPIILGIFLLALPVGVYFISQQNRSIADIRNRASGPGGTAYPCTRNSDCANGYLCTNGLCQGNSNTTSCGRNSDMGAPVCCTDMSCSGGTKVCEPPNRLECHKGGYWCTIDANGCRDQTTQPPNTPTPTQTINPVCIDVKMYKNNVQVTDFAALKAGDEVVLAVKGNLTPTKAHFRINGKKISNTTEAGWDETTIQNDSGEFTLEYTIPEGVSDFVIEGEIFTNGAWH